MTSIFLFLVSPDHFVPFSQKIDLAKDLAWQYYMMLQARTVLLYAPAASAAHESPECVKKYARVAYVILCNSVCEVRHNECTHGDEKPPPPIRDGRVYRGKKRMYGGKERVQGHRGRSPRQGVGGEPPTS